jgi:PAS domain S-box-containing protein
MCEVEILKRSVARERAARREAEQLLESKSRELFHASESLRQTTAALRQEASMTRAILQTAGEAIVSFSADGEILAVNPAAERVFGTSAETLIGGNIAQLLERGDLQQLIDHDFFVSDATAIKNCHCLRGCRHDGSCFELELAASRVELDATMLFTWMIRDVTERISLERQLAYAQKMESVGRLAAGVAHEINTPMQYVGANLQFVRDAFEAIVELLNCHRKLLKSCESGGWGSELCDAIRTIEQRRKTDYLLSEVAPALEQAGDGCQRVTSIVSAMKEFSHPGQQRKHQVDVNQAIVSTVTICRNEWKYVAEVDLQLDAELPEVLCFASDLNQAVLNLIVNAAHAIAERQERDKMGIIRIQTARRDDYIEICVSDTGVGIDPHVRERIFDPFFTTKPVGKGTGQGLSIVYSVIVEKHGGAIHVDSQPGQGTTFTLRIPAQPDRTYLDSTTSDLTTQGTDCHDGERAVC